ncbi:MAG: glycosyltransferase [Fastidiosipilaceae bacterium]
MDKTEKAFKIFTDICLVFSIYLIVNYSYPWTISIPAAVFFGHTINWIINGQICVVFKNLKLIKNDHVAFREYINGIQLRIKEEPSIQSAAAFGSLSRKSLKETSDLDVRIIRKPGVLNGIRACIFVLLERSRGVCSIFPIDIFVLDSPEQLNKLNNDEIPIILSDPDRALINFYEKKGCGILEVVMVYAYDPSECGGGGGIRYAHNLIKHLLNDNISTTLLGVKLSGENKFTEDSFEFIPVLEHSDLWWKYYLMLFLKLPFMDISEKAIIHTHRTYFMLPFIFFNQNNPKICTLHMKPLEFVKVEYPQYYKYVDRVHKIIEGYCLKRMNGVIAINEKVKQAYTERYPFLEGKISVIPGSGVDLDIFRPLDRLKIRKDLGFNCDDVIILFVGRIEKIKNIDLLISSFALLNEKVQNTKLLIAGRGGERSHLESLVRTLNLDDKISFVGEVSPDKIPAIYNCADIFALTSHSESSPTVVREALACGVPVVTTDVGDVNAILVDEDCGIIVKNNTPSEFQFALEEMIFRIKNDPELIRNNCRSLAMKKFGFAEIGDRVIDIYSRYR